VEEVLLQMEEVLLQVKEGPITGPLYSRYDPLVALYRFDAQKLPTYPCYGRRRKRFDATSESCLEFKGPVIGQYDPQTGQVSQKSPSLFGRG
jgi:hypothetical protein